MSNRPVMRDEKTWHTLFDVQVERRESHAVEFDLFEMHKEALLNILRNAHKGAPNSQAFNEDHSWHSLVWAATWYFRRATERKPVAPARRIERLRELEKTLAHASRMVRQAMQDEVSTDIFRAWWQVRDNTLPASDKAVRAVADEITACVAALNTLKISAETAARNVRTKPGPLPGRGILTMHDVLELERLYRKSTGLTPERGAGPFAQLVGAFLIAVGRADDTKHDYVVEALRYAHKKRAKPPAL